MQASLFYKAQVWFRGSKTERHGNVMKNFQKGFKKHFNAYLFISPFFILFLVFQLFPMIWSLVLSFTEWNGLGPKEFVGVQNYVMLAKDPTFWTTVQNPFLYWLVAIVFVLFFAMMVALLLSYKPLRARGFFKSMTFFPYVCATVAVGLIFNMLFDFNAGLINEILRMMGLEGVAWLTSTSLSKIPPMILYVWRNTPWYTIIIMSGILNIPADYYEAATVDGANVFQKFFKITLPCLGDILFFCFLTLTVESWKIFAEPYVMVGPGSSNMSMFQYMYQNSFVIFKMGYASAIGYILTMILLVFSLIQFFIMRRNGEA